MAVNEPLDKTQVASKVGAGAVGGAVAVILVYGMGVAGLDVPAEVAVAFGTILSFAAGWLAKTEK